MRLYYFETPNGRAPCAVAKYLGSPVEFVRVDLQKGEHKQPAYLAINPNGRIPALEDGDNRIWESTAIMCYLADKAGSDLWPKDARQIDIIRWFSWNTAHFSRHAGTLLFERFIKPNFGLGEADAGNIEEAEGFFRQFAAVLNDHLKGRNYIVGDKLSLADFSTARMLPDAAAARLPLDDYGEIRRWHEGLMELPAWKNPYPGSNE